MKRDKEKIKQKSTQQLCQYQLKGTTKEKKIQKMGTINVPSPEKSVSHLGHCVVNSVTIYLWACPYL